MQVGFGGVGAVQQSRVLTIPERKNWLREHRSGVRPNTLLEADGRSLAAGRAAARKTGMSEARLGIGAFHRTCRHPSSPALQGSTMPFEAPRLAERLASFEKALQ